MKKYLDLIIQILIIGVIIVLISNWYFDYSEETNQVIRKTMFILIGISFILSSPGWKVKSNRYLFIFCGLYLFAMNFIPKKTVFTIAGIICILVPLIIIKFSKEAKQLD